MMFFLRFTEKVINDARVKRDVEEMSRCSDTISRMVYLKGSLHFNFFGNVCQLTPNDLI